MIIIHSGLLNSNSNLPPILPFYLSTFLPNKTPNTLLMGPLPTSCSWSWAPHIVSPQLPTLPTYYYCYICRFLRVNLFLLPHQTSLSSNIHTRSSLISNAHSVLINSHPSPPTLLKSILYHSIPSHLILHSTFLPVSSCPRNSLMGGSCGKRWPSYVHPPSCSSEGKVMLTSRHPGPGVWNRKTWLPLVCERTRC